PRAWEGEVDQRIAVVLVREHQFSSLRSAAFRVVQLDPHCRQYAHAAAGRGASCGLDPPDCGAIGGNRSESTGETYRDRTVGSARGNDRGAVDRIPLGTLVGVSALRPRPLVPKVAGWRGAQRCTVVSCYT